MKHSEIIDFLNEHAIEEYKKNVIRMGIPEACCIGVPITILRKLARQIKNPML